MTHHGGEMESPSGPLVSILIPTYNRASLLKQALTSALRQTYQNLQIVVCDNNSTDDTQVVLKQFQDPRVQMIQQPTNVGPIKNGETCMSMAKGDYILVLSDDDLLMPDCISTMIEQFLAHPSATIAYGRTRFETIEGELILNTKPSPKLLENGVDYVLNWMAQKRHSAFCCTMFKASCLRNMGGFPPFFLADSTARAVVALQGDVIHVPKILAHYRVHKNSDSNSVLIEQKVEENLKMVRYINQYLPAQLRETFVSYGARYTIRSAGSQTGSLLNLGRKCERTIQILNYLSALFGWKAVLINFPWMIFLAKALLPNKIVKIIRLMR